MTPAGAWGTRLQGLCGTLAFKLVGVWDGVPGMDTGLHPHTQSNLPGPLQEIQWWAGVVVTKGILTLWLHLGLLVDLRH